MSLWFLLSLGAARAQSSGDGKKFCDPEDEGSCPKDTKTTPPKVPDKPPEKKPEKLDCPVCDDIVPQIVRATFGGSLLERLAIDTKFDNGTEHVIDIRSKLHLYVNFQWKEDAKVYIGGRFNHFTVGERSETGGFILFSAGRVRSEFEALLDEAYVDLYLKKWLKLRVGNQRFGWGANDFFAPGDVLSPLDFREGPLVDSADPLKIPVFAATTTVSHDGFSAAVAWVPFFVPHKYYVFGADFALLRPSNSLFATPPPDLTGVVDPSMIDKLQPIIGGTKIPDETISNSTAGVRLEAHKGGFDLGISYIFGWDRTPIATIDPALMVLLTQSQATSPDPAQIAGAIARITQLVSAGQPVYTAVFERQHVVAGDVGTTVGSFGLRLDFGGSPAQTTYVTMATGDVVARRLGAFSYVAGVDYSYEDNFFAQIQVLHQFYFGKDPAETLVLYKPTMVSLGFLVRGTFLRGDLEIAAQGMSNFTLGDILLRGSVSYRFWKSLRVSMGLNLYEGKSQSMGGLFDGNDSIFVQARYSF